MQQRPGERGRGNGESWASRAGGGRAAPPSASWAAMRLYPSTPNFASVSSVRPLEQTRLCERARPANAGVTWGVAALHTARTGQADNHNGASGRPSSTGPGLPGSRLHSLVVAGAVNCLQSHRRAAHLPTRHVRGGHEQAAPPAASLRLPAYRTACRTHRAANEASSSLAHDQHTLPLVHASRLLPNSLNLHSTRDCLLAASTRSSAASRPRRAHPITTGGSGPASLSSPDLSPCPASAPLANVYIAAKPPNLCFNPRQSPDRLKEPPSCKQYLLAAQVR